MNGVELRNVTKAYAGLTVMENINLQIADGDFLVLLGPSGCGKSTLLNMIAGLEPTTGGSIHINGRDVTGLEPDERDIAMVFQSYALYPTMSVRRNIGFGLKMRGMAKGEIEKRVAEVGELLQITPLLDRKPSQLSGGQQQRVAIGRALVREPSVFLFDEPLSNLDAKLRADMRIELKRLHERLGRTIVYVTHDQIEAMTLATKVVVLDKGSIQQVDTPENVYRRPANRFVASFVGAPTMNFIDGKLTHDGDDIVFDSGSGCLPLINVPAEIRDLIGRPMTLGARPEHMVFDDAGISSRVLLAEPTGPDQYVRLAVAGSELTARSGPEQIFKSGSDARILVDGARMTLFDPQSGQALLGS
ncbi:MULTISPECIES: sn-glycerol-3-phosphate ABC transporter ATP-binding protein UgpC [Thalassospira]|jgi:multiple sugar transport system ATP-binding protein|uniref:Sugar ABC transporter n=1 Tax=Thalassospira povalilytica TaxID=732237 RepID=A0ABX4R9T1_9PROT|nr:MULTISPECIES: sn-glycerol-3-phosphate ABC transporter ATP-binding protein UgpC [Thalassospira]MBO6770468.1 sn-glycerol-3-phosphate ABC transporter ATP-binding protein UgpC [Thalassospira sp.]PKR50037.1 sugar ABC transporter [Thalassospira povalilytica]URK16623.1 sn-glycerol-3-phosphate ABC transporter ATP-binding protein UgpC [Thalassospira sp. GO-4]HAY49236.1 sn-glycerol-3-phosphate ABC transporter ATP-binding protein UgpC [Thalassospira sp.]|tara:strand:- start:4 stop:1083 length:1080 start_codon:yes stop_codon:yes gene_type:complete